MKRFGLFALAVALAGASPAGAAGKEHTVSAHGAAFDPAQLTVARGDTVVWKNDDVVTHNVKAKAGAFASKDLPPDATFKWTARKKGRYDYTCTLHPGMKGVVVVR